MGKNVVDWVMIDGDVRYCGGSSSGGMAETAQWRRLQHGGSNDEDGTDIAAVVCQKRRGGSGCGVAGAVVRIRRQQQ